MTEKRCRRFCKTKSQVGYFIYQQSSNYGCNGLGSVVHVMALPICMLEPISLLEVLSLSLNHIHLLYTEEYTIQSMITISFSTMNNKSLSHCTIYSGFLFTDSISTLLYCVFPHLLDNSVPLQSDRGRNLLILCHSQ